MSDRIDIRKLLQRKKVILLAREDLITFACFMSPVPDDRDDVTISLYRPARHHKVLGAALEQIEKGSYKRLQITLPPSHGKTRLSSHMFAAWFIGKNPEKSIIVATYSEKFAWDHGRAVRDLMESPLYEQVFPKARLKAGSASVDRLETTEGGVVFFLGRGSGATGRGADVILLDDPTKDRKEADSPTIREQLWSWYTQVLQTRLMTKAGAIVIIQCLTGDTSVLMADGVEKPLREIRPGDRVATYDRSRREITVETVLNWANQGPDKVFAIRTKSGSVVKANARHPFLVENAGSSEWRRTDTLKKGDKILRITGVSGAEKPARRQIANYPPNARGSACLITTRTGGNGVFALLRSTIARHAEPISNTATALLKAIMTLCSSGKAAFAPFAKRLLASNCLDTGPALFAWTTVMEQIKLEDYSVTPVIGWSANQKPQMSLTPPLFTSEVIPDPIVEILEVGVEDVFDIQISRTENFIANKLVSSNTRWHEDDLIGRLTDPQNPCYSLAEAKKWRVIDMPAFARKDDVLGRAEGEPLWPERFDKDYLDSLRQTDVRGFQALYQGRPTPEEGSFFKAVNLRTYARMDRMPVRERLRFYCASDHAVSLEQGRDKTCLIAVGIDEHDQMWVQPDIFWKQADTNTVVEAMIFMIDKYSPIFWWAGKDHISKSIGPFLRKRMMEKRVFCSIVELSPIGDKLQRAQSIQARMAMMKVLYPSFTHWWAEAHDQMLKFPQGAHDDFVDTMANFGEGLRQQRGQRLAKPRKDPAKIMTYGWVIESARKERQREDRRTGGW